MSTIDFETGQGDETLHLREFKVSPELIDKPVTGDESSLFNGLPNELKLMICLYLPQGSLYNLQCACKSWSDIADDALISHRYTTDIYSDNLDLLDDFRNGHNEFYMALVRISDQAAIHQSFLKLVKLFNSSSSPLWRLPMKDSRMWYQPCFKPVNPSHKSMLVSISKIDLCSPGMLNDSLEKPLDLVTVEDLWEIALQCMAFQGDLQPIVSKNYIIYNRVHRHQCGQLLLHAENAKESFPLLDIRLLRLLDMVGDLSAFGISALSLTNSSTLAFERIGSVIKWFGGLIWSTEKRLVIYER